MLLGAQTFAQSQSIYIPSSTLPDHVSANQFHSLLTKNEPKNTLNAPHQEIQTSPEAISQTPSELLDKDAKQQNEALKNIRLSAKRDFEHKIRRAWHVPIGSAGQAATAHIKLADNGSVLSINIDSDDLDMKNSIATAIRDAAPFPMPSDPEARKQAQSFTSSFTAK